MISPVCPPLPLAALDGLRGALIRDGEVLLGPTGDLLERRQESTACVGEIVGNRDGRPLVDATVGEPGGAELTQSIGGHVEGS